MVLHVGKKLDSLQPVHWVIGHNWSHSICATLSVQRHIISLSLEQHSLKSTASKLIIFGDRFKLYCHTLTKGSNSWKYEISHKWAKWVCHVHVHWHQCNNIMSWLEYLSAGWVFLLQTRNGSRILYKPLFSRTVIFTFLD